MSKMVKFEIQDSGNLRVKVIRKYLEVGKIKLEKSYNFYILKEKLDKVLFSINDYESEIDRDISNFCTIKSIKTDNILQFNFVWLNQIYDYNRMINKCILKGEEETINLNLNKFIENYNTKKEFKMLEEKEKPIKIQIDKYSSLKKYGILNNKIIKNKFRKMIRDLSTRVGGKMMLGNDDNYNFWFVCYDGLGGFQYNGGLIFHKSDRDLVESYGKFNNKCELQNGRYSTHT